jgi:hypothetical protein
MNIHTPRRKEVAPANVPALPHLADKAAHDLMRSAKSMTDGLRAIEAWFTQHGDPFVPLAPTPFTAALNAYKDALDKTSAELSNAELMAMLSYALEAIVGRLGQAIQRHEP